MCMEYLLHHAFAEFLPTHIPLAAKSAEGGPWEPQKWTVVPCSPWAICQALPIYILAPSIYKMINTWTIPHCGLKHNTFVFFI